jgi:hypothetical protein
MTRALVLALALALPAATAHADPSGVPEPLAAPAPPRAEDEPAPPKPPAQTAPAPATRMANGQPLPEVPQIADEPLPPWLPPRVTPKAQYLSVHPELQRSQRLRQAGLWMASVGGAALLVGGIIWARALDINDDIGVGCRGSLGPAGVVNGNVTCTGMFDPKVEDARDLNANVAVALFSVGGALMGTGLALFGTGQQQIDRWHHRHPADPLPVLSGY